MKFIIPPGKTSVSVALFIQSAARTDGGGLTGLVYNSAGLKCYYVFPGNDPVEIELVSLAANNSAWDAGGFRELDASNMPGYYRFDVPDELFETEGEHPSITLHGAVNMAQLPCEFAVEYPQVNVKQWLDELTIGTSTGGVTYPMVVLKPGQLEITRNLAMPFFPFRLPSGNTGKTVTIRINKDNGGFDFSDNGNPAAELVNGWYNAAWTANDLNAEVIGWEFLEDGVVVLADTIRTATP